MKLNDLKKFEIIRGLWLIVKSANNENISLADLSDGIEDGETPETYFEEIVKDFDRFFRLYAGLAIEAMKNDGDGVYLGDLKVINADDYTGAFDE